MTAMQKIETKTPKQPPALAIELSYMNDGQ